MHPTRDHHTAPLSAPPLPPPRRHWRPTVLDRYGATLRGSNTGPYPKRRPLGEVLSSLVAFWRQPHSVLCLLLFALCVGIFLWQASIYWVAVIDDAYITFRFSDNLVRGHGLVFNPGGMRVEGFTNFTWMMAMAGALWAGWDVMLASKLLGLVCAVGTMAASWALTARLREKHDLLNLLPVVFLACNAHFAHWSLMGLETLMAVWFIIAAYARFVLEMRDGRAWLISPLLATLAAMTRIDSLYFLSPLGLFGILLILRAQLPLRRMVHWALIAALTFGAYFGWRIAYFGDVFPNTYYAKQRLVELNTGRPRGLSHLYHFYLNQNTGDAAPKAWKDIPAAAKEQTAQKAARVGWHLRLRGYNSAAWSAWWFLGVVGLLAWPRMRTLVLVAMPIAMNAYYVYHVDGDWMPNFRFFQVALPFLGVAGAVSLGMLVERLWTTRVRRVLAGISVAMAAFLMLSLCLEQLRVSFVYVFGKDPLQMYRKAGWWRPAEVRKQYSGGFSPPLQWVSDWMLLNTVDNGSIFMSDIGQPLWFCEHLNLYDVDGLTDKYLAHAPSVRGELKTLSQLTVEVLRERNQPSPTAAQAQEAEMVAKRRDFEAHLTRNADYILGDKKPEYLLIFLSHEGGDPKKRGWPYPEISAKVYNDPRREQDYVLQHQVSKIGNVYNNFLRRKEVPEVVSDAVKARRLRRALERNPRFHYLVPLAYREAWKMGDAQAREQTLALVKEWTPRVLHHEETRRQLVHEATTMADELFLRTVLGEEPSESLNDPARLRTRAEGAWRQDRKEEAARLLERAAELMPNDDNSVHYMLSYYYEELGRPADSARISREAIARQPEDLRAWQDLGSVAHRSTFKAGLTPEELDTHRRTALEGFQGQVRLQGEETPEIVLRFLGEMERALQAEAPAPTGS